MHVVEAHRAIPGTDRTPESFGLRLIEAQLALFVEGTGRCVQAWHDACKLDSDPFRDRDAVGMQEVEQLAVRPCVRSVRHKRIAGARREEHGLALAGEKVAHEAALAGARRTGEQNALASGPRLFHPNPLALATDQARRP